MKRFANHPLGGIPKAQRKPVHLRFIRLVTCAALVAALAAPPATADYSIIPAGGWGMHANGPGADNPPGVPDGCGDCVFAAGGNFIEGLTANAGDPLIIPASCTVSDYSTVTGYVPGDDSTDNGTDPAAMLAFAVNTGLSTPNGPHKIGAFAAIDPTHPVEFKLAIDMFECAFVSLALPSYWQTLEDNGDVWDVAPDGTDPSLTTPGSWGYHEVISFKYTEAGIEIITWDAKILITWAAIAAGYVDGGNVAISTDIVNGTTTAPTGFDYSVLVADLPLVSAA